MRLGIKIVQHVKTKNDSNGNPRRLFVFYSRRNMVAKHLDMVKVIEEGYSGRPGEADKAFELPPVNVSPAEYREFVRAAKVDGVYVERS